MKRFIHYIVLFLLPIIGVAACVTTYSNYDQTPKPVSEKYAQIYEAAQNSDIIALSRLAEQDQIKYSFGEKMPGGAAAFWKLQMQNGFNSTENLRMILKSGGTFAQGSYVWPSFAYKDLKDYTDEEKNEAVKIMRLKDFKPIEDFGGYYGPRTAITPEGRWIYYVSGD